MIGKVSMTDVSRNTPRPMKKMMIIMMLMC